MMKEIVLEDGLRVRIRSQTLEDIGGLWQLYSCLSGRTRMFAGIPEQIQESGFRERMVKVVGSKYQRRFVCVTQQPQEEFIGYFGIDISEADSRTGWIFLVVQDARQGRGLGKEILRYTMEEAPSLGLKVLKLMVYAENKRAIELFKKFDFRKEKESIDPETGKPSYMMSRTIS